MLGDYQSTPPMPLSPEDVRLASSVQYVLAMYLRTLAAIAQHGADYPLRRRCQEAARAQARRLRESHWLFPVEEGGGTLSAFHPPPACREASQDFVTTLNTLSPADCDESTWRQIERQLLALLKRYLSPRPHPLIQLWLADVVALVQRSIDRWP